MKKAKTEAASLLVEILSEELPPKSLRALSEAFRDRLVKDLARLQLAKGDQARAFATPRRLAVLIPDVQEKGEDRINEVKGPPVKAGEQAIAGFAKKQGVAVDSLTRANDAKGEIVVARVNVKGAVLNEALAGLVQDALKSLPIPKVMRWGDGDAQFVRPVHGLVMLHGKRVVKGTVLGLESSSSTQGHRFLGKSPIVLKSADDYEKALAKEGKVIADFAARRAEIESQLKARAAKEKASLGTIDALLDEVTALVEHPSVYMGTFEPAFLEVPQECLILTMRQNQKYFPLFDAGGKLLPKFLIVSNMQVADPKHIIGGNERVVRPRLDDARFFYAQDRKSRLESRVPQLAKVVYHGKLGTQLERVERIQRLAAAVAAFLQADATAAGRAALLCKADLLTGMVGEFPELQGIMGRYYALADGESAEVADAIEAHYRPRFAGDAPPRGPLACALALADKLDTLAGLFGAGQQPTGEKDPFGLRRAALGVIRIIVEQELPVSLNDLVNAAFENYRGKIANAGADLLTFVLERYEGYLAERGYSKLQIDAVLSKRPARISLVPKQLEAVKAFELLPEAASLAAANKRVANILRQAQGKGESFANAELSAMKEPADQELFRALHDASERARALFDKGDFAGYLKTFAVLKKPVDAFFESVMVMAEDRETRQGRLALLSDLSRAMNRFANLDRLAQ